MQNNLTYIVLGASGGIGSETSRRLHQSGASVVLAGRNEAKLKSLSDEINRPFRVLDATAIDQVEALLESTSSATPIAGIVNCVGSILLKPAHLTSADEWQDTLTTNLTSAFATVRAAAKSLRKTGGSVVLLSSAAAQIGLPNHEAIAAAKAGIDGLVRSAAASYAGRGLRINAVAPGLVQTEMTEKIWSSPKSAEASRGMHALGRLGRPSDIASLICWLLEPENDWISGQVISVDGGLGSLRVPGKS